LKNSERYNLTRYQGVAFSVLKERAVESKLFNNTGCQASFGGGVLRLSACYLIVDDHIRQQASGAGLPALREKPYYNASTPGSVKLARQVNADSARYSWRLGRWR
jgi:hypothetical protein